MEDAHYSMYSTVTLYILPSKHDTLKQCWDYCWASVADGGPTLNQHSCFNVSCLLGNTVLLYYSVLFLYSCTEYAQQP